MTRTLFTVGKILLIISVVLYENGNAQNQDNHTDDYSKLQLNREELKGSRWALDQTAAITVFHAVQIVDMVKVDVNDMSIRVDFHLRQRWNATGLVFPEGLFKPNDNDNTSITAEENVLKSVWSPDSFIPNARETKILAMASAQSAVNIHKNKEIIFKARMYATLGCSFTFQWYPLDIQVCDLVFESYKYGNKIVDYDWEPNRPVTHEAGILLYQYDFFLPPMLSKGTHQRWAGHNDYPYVKMTFKFERKLGNNVIQIFVPTILVVVLSFFSFWLGLDAVPGRISLLVTCILTLVTMHSGLKGVIPPVHYIKMMDIWMIGCMVFVFGAICEFIVVKYMKWRTMQIKAAKDEQEKYMQKNGLNRPLPPTVHPTVHPAFQNGGGVNKQPFSNAVYPEYGQHITSIQNGRNFSQNELLSNSAQKRQAWHNAQVQQALGAQQGLDPHHGGYPGFVNIPGMPFYNNQQFIQSPPPVSRPLWVNIDRVCRVLFPFLFAVFNAAFWPVLLIGASKQHADVQPNTV